MEPGSVSLVVVFPISTSAFGLRSDWFEMLTPKLVRPSFLLVTLLLVIWIGMLALQRFEHADFEKKVWNVPVLLTTIIFWPSLVLGLKELVDTFNTFLVVNVFAIPWQGFGFPELGSISDIALWPSAGLARLLPNLAYWIIYAFYIVFFFFYAVIGPLVLAKGVLLDEIENFFEIVKELVLLLLWQTTLLILVALVMPSIVSGEPFPPRPDSNIYFMSIVLGVLIFFIPALTRKFGAHLESAFVPLGFRWGGGMVGLAAAARLGVPLLAHAGVSTEALERMRPYRDQILRGEEFKRRYENRATMRDQSEDRRDLIKKLREYDDQERSAQNIFSQATESQADRFVMLSKKAKQEMKRNDDNPNQ
jgi:hypothetical protein